MKYQIQIAAVLVCLAFVGGVFVYGYHKGTVNQIAKQLEAKQELQEQLFDLNEILFLKNAEILRMNQEREELVNELENQALSTKGSDAPGVSSTGGLQRLERRWGSSPTTP